MGTHGGKMLRSDGGNYWYMLQTIGDAIFTVGEALLEPSQPDGEYCVGWDRDGGHLRCGNEDVAKQLFEEYKTTGGHENSCALFDPQGKWVQRSLGNPDY